MYNRKEFWDHLDALRDTLETLPRDQHFSLDENTLEFQAHTQEQVKRIRALFSGVIWKKEYNKGCNWWSYRGNLISGLKLHIYAVSEAPATCKAITEKRPVMRVVTPEVKEPTGQMETVIIGWDCNNSSPANVPWESE